MALTLYDVSVTNFLQTLGAVSGYLEKSRAWAVENGHDLDALVDTRLHGDMLPFRFQIVSVAHHSSGAIAGAKAGVFSPPGGVGELDYAGLQGLVAEAIASLKAETPEAANRQLRRRMEHGGAGMPVRTKQVSARPGAAGRKTGRAKKKR